MTQGIVDVSETAEVPCPRFSALDTSIARAAYLLRGYTNACDGIVEGFAPSEPIRDIEQVWLEGLEAQL